jgi:hypothetical protein
VRNKQKARTGYETCTCFMALYVSEKYQSEIHRPLEHLEFIGIVAQIVAES